MKREKLIRLAIRYGGDYFQIREALKRQEDPEEIPLPGLLGMIPSSRSAVDSLVRREVLLRAARIDREFGR